MRISDWSSDVCSSDLQTFVGQLELAGLEAVRLHLLGDQVQLRDLDLLVLGIAFETDDLHAIEQRLRQVQRVGRGHEHDVGQVDVDLQIMILELRILFRSEEHTSELQSLMRISYA